MTKNDASKLAVAAMRAAYSAIHEDDLGNMTSWEMRDAMIDAVEQAFAARGSLPSQAPAE